MTNNLELLRRIYDEVPAALWAILLAFISYFIIFVVAKMPEARDRAAVTQATLEASIDTLLNLITLP
jgi:hypothetical protein